MLEKKPVEKVGKKYNEGEKDAGGGGRVIKREIKTQRKQKWVTCRVSEKRLKNANANAAQTLATQNCFMGVGSRVGVAQITVECRELEAE